MNKNRSVIWIERIRINTKTLECTEYVISFEESYIYFYHYSLKQIISKKGSTYLCKLINNYE